MEPRLLNDVDIGQTFKFRVAFETLGQSKSSGKPMITIGLSLTTLGDIPIEKMVYLYFVSTVQWRINDFIAKIDKKHIHVEYLTCGMAGIIKEHSKTQKGIALSKRIIMAIKLMSC